MSIMALASHQSTSSTSSSPSPSSLNRMSLVLWSLLVMSLWYRPEAVTGLILPLTSKMNSSGLSDKQVVHFHKLANTHNLHNPCSPGRQPKEDRSAQMSLEDDVSYSELTGLTSSPGNKVGLSLLRELITKSSFLQGLATNVIRMVSHKTQLTDCNSRSKAPARLDCH